MRSVPGECHRYRQGVLAGGGRRFQVWRAALEARYRAPARTTIVEPDGQRPDSPRRLHPREPRRGVRCSDVWPGTRCDASVGSSKPRGMKKALEGAHYLDWLV